MVNRWSLAVLMLLVMFAAPLAAQESSPPASEESDGEMTQAEAIGEVIVEPIDVDSSDPEIANPGVTDPEIVNEASIQLAQDVWGMVEPPIDVTELKASLVELLPTTAPAPPSLPSILPANTPAAVIVNTRDQAWATLNQYELFAQVMDSFGVSASPEMLPLLPYGLNYGEDVQPWIGDGFAIALLPIPSTRTVAPVERSVTIVPIGDAAAFVDFIPTLAESRAALPEQKSYRSFPIWHWPAEFVPYEAPDWEAFPESEPQEFPEPELPDASFTPVAPLVHPQSPNSDPLTRAYRQPEPPSIYIPDGNYSEDGYTLPGYAVTHLGNYIVAAETIDSLRQWIEYQTQGGPLLTSNPSFEKTQSHPQAQASLATVYGNVGELVNFEFSNPFQGFGLPPIPEPSLSDRAALSASLRNVTFDMLVYPETQGMRLSAHIYTEGALPPIPPSPNADHSILSLMPAPTYVLGSGYDISGVWNDFTSAFSLSDVTGGLLETARAIVSLTTGLDLDTDILSWMDGEYSLFLFPSRTGLLNAFVPGLGLEAGVLLETSNRSAAETALVALDQVVGQDVALSDTIGQQPISNWQYDINTDGTLDSVLSHTWLTDDTLAFTSGAGAMERLVVPAGFNPLSGHSTFLNATATFPNPNNGYFYVNASSTLTLFYNLFGFNTATEPWAVDVKRFLGTIRSLSMTTATSAETLQIDALLGLAPRQGPLPEAEVDDDVTDGDGITDGDRAVDAADDAGVIKDPDSQSPPP